MELPIIHDAASAASALVNISCEWLPLYRDWNCPGRSIYFVAVSCGWCGQHDVLHSWRSAFPQDIPKSCISQTTCIALQVRCRLVWRRLWAVLLKIWIPWHALDLINLLKGLNITVSDNSGGKVHQVVLCIGLFMHLGCPASQSPRPSWWRGQRMQCPTACWCRTCTLLSRRSSSPVSLLSNSCFAPLMLFWARWALRTISRPL